MLQTPNKQPTQLTLSLSGENISDMAPKSRTPSSIAKKMVEVSSSLKNKRSMSQEDFHAMLESAAERKKTIDEHKSQKAKELVEKAKYVASKTKQENIVVLSEKLEKIQGKLDTAANKKVQNVNEKRQKLEHHLTIVDERKNGATAKAQNDALLKKLEAAEVRRKAIEQNIVNKLSEHNKIVVSVKKASSPKTSAEASKLFEKLVAAEKRRKFHEMEQSEKLFKHELHAKEVRSRKLMVGEVQECV